MNIRAEEYKITMTHSELWNTAFDVRRALFLTFKDHWVNHQDAWKKHESQRLNTLREMFYAVGRPDLFEEIEIEKNKIFKEFNDK